MSRTPTERKKHRIRRRIKLLGIKWLRPKSVVLAEDETDLRLFPPLGFGLAFRGEQAKVVLSGRNAKRVLFGSINLKTGHRLFVAREEHKAPAFQEFLWQCHLAYRQWKPTLLLDEDASHTAGGSIEMARGLGIELLWLPKRSPELNPMDHLWRDGKKVILTDRQFPTIREEVDQFVTYLRSLSSTQALTKAGILSPSFWLR